jgi:hypothetical protein
MSTDPLMLDLCGCGAQVPGQQPGSQLPGIKSEKQGSPVLEDFQDQGAPQALPAGGAGGGSALADHHPHLASSQLQQQHGGGVELGWGVMAAQGRMQGAFTQPPAGAAAGSSFHGGVAAGGAGVTQVHLHIQQQQQQALLMQQGLTSPTGMLQPHAQSPSQATAAIAAAAAAAALPVSMAAAGVGAAGAAAGEGGGGSGVLAAPPFGGDAVMLPTDFWHDLMHELAQDPVVDPHLHPAQVRVCVWCGGLAWAWVWAYQSLVLAAWVTSYMENRFHKGEAVWVLHKARHTRTSKLSDVCRVGSGPCGGPTPASSTGTGGR